MMTHIPAKACVHSDRQGAPEAADQPRLYSMSASCGVWQITTGSSSLSPEAMYNPVLSSSSPRWRMSAYRIRLSLLMFSPASYP